MRTNVETMLAIMRGKRNGMIIEKSEIGMSTVAIDMRNIMIVTVLGVMTGLAIEMIGKDTAEIATTTDMIVG